MLPSFEASTSQQVGASPSRRSRCAWVIALVQLKRAGRGTRTLGTDSHPRSFACCQIVSSKDGMDMTAIREVKFLRELKHPNVIEVSTWRFVSPVQRCPFLALVACQRQTGQQR